MTKGGFNLNWLQFRALNIVRDSDQDGVIDSRDYCPSTPKGVDVNGVGCEVGLIAVSPFM